MKFGFKFEKFHDSNQQSIKRLSNFMAVFRNSKFESARRDIEFFEISSLIFTRFRVKLDPIATDFSKRPRIYTEHCSNARHFYYTDRSVKQIVARGHGCREARIYASSVREMRRVKGLWKQRQP